jgi:transglutaminase-like putative cysteine protease/streptogramin lyase
MPRFLVALVLSPLLVSLAASSLPAAIGDVEVSFPAPGQVPTDLAIWGTELWAADWEQGTLYRLDPGTGEVRQELSAPCSHPEGLASDGTLLYVSDAETQRVFLFDPGSGLTVASYPAPESSPKGLAFGGGSLWLLDDGTDTIYEMVPGDGTILNYYKAPHKLCRGLAHDGTHLWVTDRGLDELYAVRPSDGTVLFLVRTRGAFPVGLAAGHGSLWLADFQERTISRLGTDADVPYRVTDEVERDFRYHYSLRNDGTGTITEASIHLAVPYASLPNQTILGDIRWTPAPDGIVTDRWGQEVAVFRSANVPAGERAQATYGVRVRLGELHYAFFPSDVKGLAAIPSDVATPNTVPTSRLQLDNELVTKTAREIVGDEENPYWMARGIYDWVRESLEYNRVGGWDVPTTLIKRGTGSCSEYAFLYIALCRAVGLPARYEGSVVVRGDDASLDDVYHRWCEVYLPGIGWMPVDPSGGDREWPADQARYFGGLSNRFLITTHGGGDSEYLGWDYNAHAVYTYEGRGTVYEEGYGVWSPVTGTEGEPTAGGVCEDPGTR